MKKWIALLLAVLFVLSMIGCGAKKDEENKETQQDEQNTPSNPSTEPEPEPFAIELPMTLIDNDKCSVVLTGIDPDNYFGYTLNVQLENKTADQKLSFTTDDGYVNGIEWDPIFIAEVAAGKKANDEISFMNTTLQEVVKEYTDIELTLRVRVSDDYSADPVALETVHIYPLGEDKAERYVYVPQPDDIVLADNEMFTAVVTGFDPDGLWGYTVNLYIENKSDLNLMFSARDVSVNGFMLDAYWGKLVAPGRCTITSMDWTRSDFEKNGITEVTEIEMQFAAYDSDDWFNGYELTVPVTLNP